MGGILNCLFFLLLLTLGHEPLVAADIIVNVEFILAMRDCGMDSIEARGRIYVTSVLNHTVKAP